METLQKLIDNRNNCLRGLAAKTHTREEYKAAQRAFLRAKYVGMTWKQINQTRKIKRQVLSYIKKEYGDQQVTFLKLLAKWALLSDTRPSKLPIILGRTHKEMYQRSVSWVILDWSWIIKLAKLIAENEDEGNIIDWGAGTGWLTFCLNCTLKVIGSNKTVIAHDFAIKDNEWFKDSGIQAPLIIDSQEPTSYSIVICCWPPYNDAFAHQVLQKAIDNNAKYFIYIGEGQGGCNGTDDFFELLYKYEGTYVEDGFKRWFGTNDFLTIYDLSKPL